MPETIVVLTREEFMRELRDRSLLQIAEGCGVSYPTLARMRGGESNIINLTVRKKVTDFLGVANGK